MGEDFQAGVCGSTWWSSPRGSIRSLSPCFVGIKDFGNFGWPSRDVLGITSDQGSMFYDQYMQNPSESSLIDFSTTTFTTTDWSQDLIIGVNEGSETNYEGVQDSIIDELNQTRTTHDQGLCLTSSLPMNSSSYGYPSNFIDNLFGDDLPLENEPLNFPSTTNYRTNISEFSASMENMPPLLTHLLPKQQAISPLNLTNNSSIWNASISAPSEKIATTFPSTQAPIIEKSNHHNLKLKSDDNGVNQDIKKSSVEPVYKRPRMETPSPLPTFKVRKEKLGDHITALQQLVSPFGKTDTASVLQEAIEYIRYLHDQVNVLSTPYMKNGAPIIEQQQNNENSKTPERMKQDLKSRGLCLVPISSTFPVANETPPDFWTPTFGGHSDREHIQSSLKNANFCPYLV